MFVENIGEFAELLYNLINWISKYSNSKILFCQFEICDGYFGLVTW